MRPRFRDLIHVVAATAACVTAAGCGGGEGAVDPQPKPEPEPPPAPAVASVLITPASVQLEPGDTAQMVATVRDTRGAVLNRAPVWSVSSESIAAVLPDGKVIAKNAGSITVTAQVDTARGVAAASVMPRTIRVRIADSVLWVSAQAAVTSLVSVIDDQGAVRPPATLRFGAGDPSVVVASSVKDTNSGTLIRVGGLNRGEAFLRIEALSPQGRAVASDSVRVLVRAPVTARLDVDMSRLAPVTLRAGFLHGIANGGWTSTTDDIPDSLVRLLKPRFWRTRNLRMYPRLAGYGAEMMVETMFFSHVDRVRTGLWPYEEWSTYERSMRDSIRTNPRTDIVWEVWNEYDIGLPYWAGTEAQAMETYRRASAVLRAELGASARIAGPTLGRYDLATIRRWADFCLSAGCQFNVLVWHALEFEVAPDTYARQVEEVMREIIQNPAYAPLQIHEIQINEYNTWAYNYSPGATLNLLYHFERSPVTAVARACWEELTTTANGCESNGVDGTLDPAGRQRRAAWWAHRVYADGRDSRVSSTTTDPRFVALGSRTGFGGRPQVLVGFLAPGDFQMWYGVELSLTGLAALGYADGTPVTVQVRRLPSETKESEVTALPILAERSATVVNGQLLVPLEIEKRRWERLSKVWLAPYDALVVTVAQ